MGWLSCWVLLEWNENGLKQNWSGKASFLSWQRFGPNTFVTFSPTWHLSSRFHPCPVVFFATLKVRNETACVSDRLSTEIVRVPRMAISRILTWPCENLQEILKNYPCLYNQLNPCSRALQSVKTLRTRRTRTCGPGAPNPGSGPGAGAGAGVFKFLPNASNRMPLGIEILPKWLNVHSPLLFASYWIYYYQIIG